jgi:hypothetical protein
MSDKKNDDDAFYKLREWQEHQYDPAYWVNHLPPGFPPKRTRGLWFLALIFVFLFISTFFLMLWLYLSERDPYLIRPLIIFGLLSLLSLWVAKRFKPSKVKQTDLPGIEDSRNLGKRHNKKKYPKRRKDFD